MKLILPTSVILTVIGSASAWAPSWPAGWQSSCISQSAAETLVAEYAAVVAQMPSDLGSPEQTAEIIAADDYYEQSDSANQQIGLPLGAVTTASKAVFINESQSNPPLVTDTLGVYVACNYVTWQWVSYVFGSGQYEVKGFHLFEVTPAGPQIENAHFEFNSVAGALDTGITNLLTQLPPVVGTK